MEILSQTEILEQVGGWPDVVVAAIFVIIFAASSWFFAYILDLDAIGVICGLLLTFFILLTSSGLWMPKDVPTGRYEYKVILDETYPATQLYEEYEVVGQDGKIWIIQEKESKD